MGRKYCPELYCWYLRPCIYISVPLLYLYACFETREIFFIWQKLPFVAVYNRFSLLKNAQKVVFLSEVLNPWVIFVVVIFILQDYKKIEAFKPPLLLLEDFLSSPSRPSSWGGEGGGRTLRIYSKLRNLWRAAKSKHATEWSYFNAAQTSI